MSRLYISWTMSLVTAGIVLGCMRIDNSRRSATKHRLALLGESIRAVVDQQGDQVPLRTIREVLVATKPYRELSDEYLGSDGWNRRFAVSDSMITDNLRVIAVHSLGADVSTSEDDLFMCVLVGSESNVDVIGP